MSPCSGRRHGVELFDEGHLGAGETTEIDHRDLLELQAGEIGLHPGAQLLRPLGPSHCAGRGAAPTLDTMTRSSG